MACFLPNVMDWLQNLPIGHETVIVTAFLCDVVPVRPSEIRCLCKGTFFLPFFRFALQYRASVAIYKYFFFLFATIILVIKVSK